MEEMKKKAMVIMLLIFLFMARTLAESGLTQEDFFIQIGQGKFGLKEEATLLIKEVEKLNEEPLEIMKAESCLFKGEDKEFIGEDIIIATYPSGKNEKDIVETIYIEGGKYETARGIQIGMGKQEVIEAYGENYVQEHDQMIYTFKDIHKDPWLVFVLDLETEQVLQYFIFANTGV